MRSLFIVLLLLLVIDQSPASTCKGEDPCRACHNCTQCKYFFPVTLPAQSISADGGAARQGENQFVPVIENPEIGQPVFFRDQHSTRVIRGKIVAAEYPVTGARLLSVEIAQETRP